MGKGKRAEEAKSCCGWKFAFDDSIKEPDHSSEEISSGFQNRSAQVVMPVFDTPSYAPTRDCFSCFGSRTTEAPSAKSSPVQHQVEIRVVTESDTPHQTAAAVIKSESENCNPSAVSLAAAEAPAALERRVLKVRWADRIAVYHDVPTRCSSRAGHVENHAVVAGPIKEQLKEQLMQEAIERVEAAKAVSEKLATEGQAVRTVQDAETKPFEQTVRTATCSRPIGAEDIQDIQTDCVAMIILQADLKRVQGDLK